ncbi:MAG: HAD hydrolase-like protein [Chitinivibrionales bacterium]|nr:HAD hydrolase-like protein [Chitinivibrionales bacterium]
MPEYSPEILKSFAPEKEFFIGIDSDGCVFDSMEIKHKECFCPPFVNHFELQPVAKYAREVWEFVNLYSKTRGYNRFKALLRALELLAKRKEVADRRVTVPQMQGVIDWVGRESRLGNPALIEEVKRNPDPDLQTALRWSTEVNEYVAKIVRNVPPFPLVTESLQKLTEQADAIVVSQTPCEALEREWREHGIGAYVRIIAGQEMGAKAEHLALAAHGKYQSDKMLMIGDAPGDYRAAKENGALFFPINPGHEEDSWKLLYAEGLGRFFDGSYAGNYENELVDKFNSHLPEETPW